MTANHPLKKYRVPYVVTLTEWYEIEATGKRDAIERAYCEGVQVDELGNPCDRGVCHEAIEDGDAVLVILSITDAEGANRARRAKAALQAYRAYTGDMQCSPDEDLIDLLCDLRHFADLEGLCFGACDRIAYRHYVEELGRNGGAA